MVVGLARCWLGLWGEGLEMRAIRILIPLV